MADFLSVGKYESVLPAHIQEELEHCLLTNWTGKNMFGEVDSDMAQKRNCSFHHLSSINMMKHNKTSRWLGPKGADEMSELLSTAHRRAKQLRDQHRQREKVVLLKISETSGERAEEADEGS